MPVKPVVGSRKVIHHPSPEKSSSAFFTSLNCALPLFLHTFLSFLNSLESFIVVYFQPSQSVIYQMITGLLSLSSAIPLNCKVKSSLLLASTFVFQIAAYSATQNTDKYIHIEKIPASTYMLLS